MPLKEVARRQRTSSMTAGRRRGVCWKVLGVSRMGSGGDVAAAVARA